MNREYIEKNQIVDRYLLGDLSEKEQEDFEEFYFHNQDIVGELELGEKMIDGFKAARDRGALPDIAAPRVGEGPGRRGSSFAVPYGMAASVALVVSLFYNASLYREAEVQRSTTEALLQPQEFRIESLDRTRGVRATPSRTIYISEEPEWFALKLPMESSEADFRAREADSDHYRIGLTSHAGEGVPVIHTYDDDSLTIIIHSSQMADGEYVVSVDRLGESGQYESVAPYAFRVKGPLSQNENSQRD